MSYINNQNKDNKDQVRHWSIRPTKQSTQKNCPFTIYTPLPHTNPFPYNTDTNLCPHKQLNTIPTQHNMHEHTSTPHSTHTNEEKNIFFKESENRNTRESIVLMCLYVKWHIIAWCKFDNLKMYTNLKVTTKITENSGT